MEFTVVAKEVKLMALQRGIRIHQYLDDWLVRATSHQTCLQHTQTLVALCRELGWLVNEKSELDPKQVFNFVGYQFDLKEGKVRPTPERWQTLTDKIMAILSGPVCPVRQFVPYRTSDSHRKTSPPRSTSHETHTVALEKQLEGTRITRKGDTHSQVAPPSLKAVFALERDFASLYTLWGELSQNQLTNASVLSLLGETLKTDWRNSSIIGSDDIHVSS